MNNGLEMYNPSGETIERLTSFLSSFLNLTKPTLHDFYGFHVFQQISYETTLQLTKGAVGGAECTRIGKTAEVWVACKLFYMDISIISVTFCNSAYNP